MNRKPVIFVVISVLVVALSYSWFEAFAVPPDLNWGLSGDCVVSTDSTLVTCCWDEPDILNPGETVSWCQSCDPAGENCTEVFSQSHQPTGPFAPPQDGILEQPPTPPPSGPAAPRQGGVLEQPPSQGVAPPLTRGQGVLPGEGVLQETPSDQGATEPPVTEGTSPATVEEEPPVPVCQEGLEFNEDLGFCVPEECPEGQVLDEETGICVLQEPEAPEEEPETAEEELDQPEPEEPNQQTDNSEDNNNN